MNSPAKPTVVKPSVSSFVVDLGEPLQPDVDEQIKQQAAEDRSEALRTVLQSWESEQQADRKLKKIYGGWLLFALFIQIIAINTAFFLIGFEKLKVDEWTSRTFIVAVFIELGAMVRFIVKYLFGQREPHIFDLIKHL